MYKALLIILMLMGSLESYAQKRLTLSGVIRDEVTGETLIGATVKIKELSQSGTSTNNYGFYSLSALEGEYTLIFSYVGYQPIIRTVSLRQNQTINVSISAKGDLQEVGFFVLFPSLYI